MSRERDDDIYEFVNSDTIKRAEEMCSSLSSTLGLERRGQTTFYQGAISDMGAATSRFSKVTVADSGSGNDQLTLIAEKPLPSSNNALLVYRAGPGDDLKYLGKHGDTRPGQRTDDVGQERHIATYTILRDVRQR
ncbi:MAG: hypothetical protein GVY32_04035 [Gammaproteobacteria bacterium]|jgi:hypothetical protein|nr:hypothetical protein [Gammaproteobacteria bacterium]